MPDNARSRHTGDAYPPREQQEAAFWQTNTCRNLYSHRWFFYRLILWANIWSTDDMANTGVTASGRGAGPPQPPGGCHSARPDGAQPSRERLEGQLYTRGARTAPHRWWRPDKASTVTDARRESVCIQSRACTAPMPSQARSEDLATTHRRGTTLTINANASLATIHVQGRTYPAVTRATCRTCQAGDLRQTIERELVTGRTYSTIAARLPEESGISARNIADHFRNGHLPLDNEQVQRLATEQAEERGEVAGVQVQEAADHLSLARLIVERTQERLLTGELQPTTRDGVAAARLLADLAPAQAQGFGIDEASAIVRFFESARTAMQPEQWKTFLGQIRADPVLNALRQRQSTSGELVSTG